MPLTDAKCRNATPTMSQGYAARSTKASAKHRSAVVVEIFDQPFPLTNYLCHWSKRWSYIYVETPKAACTTVKRVLQQAEVGGGLAFDLPGDVHNRRRSPLLAPKDDIDKFAKAIRSPDYFRFCFARNPFTRILSCYLDKMVKTQFERRRLAPKLARP